MAAPVIKLFEANDTDNATAWDAGTIKAGNKSTDSSDPAKQFKEIHVWNNHAQEDTTGNDMIECTVTTLTADGTDDQSGSKNLVDYEHIKGGWIEVNLNDATDNTSGTAETKWVKVGGSIKVDGGQPGPMAIRAIGHKKRKADDMTDTVITDTTSDDYDPIQDDVIEGIANDGKIATEASTPAVAKLKFRVNVDGDAQPGIHTYKIRVQGYYL